mgnify:CR=1 FL=1
MNRPNLHASLQLGAIEVPNRIVMPPMVVWKATADGTVTEPILEHYRRSAGPGMVIVEATVVSPEGRLARTQIGAFEDRHVDGLARLAELIHGAGAVASIQLHHAGPERFEARVGRACTTRCRIDRRLGCTEYLLELPVNKAPMLVQGLQEAVPLRIA